MKKAGLTTASFLLFIASCASLYPSAPPLDLSSYVWPRPPDEPLVRLIRYISTDADIRGKKAVDKMFGDSGELFFGKPHDIAADSSGNVYVTDTKHRAVIVVNFVQKSIKTLPSSYGFKTPTGVAVDDAKGLLAIADADYGRVFVFELGDYRLRFQIGQWGELKRPVGVAFDPKRERLYISDSKKHEIYVYDYNGKLVSTLATYGSEKGQVYYPTDMAIDGSGALYVVDSMNYRIQVFYPDKNSVRVLGRHGDKDGAFARPKSVAVGAYGELFVSDAARSDFQIFDPDGRFIVRVGQKGDAPGKFNIPQGICSDKDGNIYIVDQANRRLQVFRYLSKDYDGGNKDGQR